MAAIFKRWSTTLYEAICPFANHDSVKSKQRQEYKGWPTCTYGAGFKRLYGLFKYNSEDFSDGLKIRILTIMISLSIEKIGWKKVASHNWWISFVNNNNKVPTLKIMKHLIWVYLLTTLFLLPFLGFWHPVPSLSSLTGLLFPHILWRQTRGKQSQQFNRGISLY